MKSLIPYVLFASAAGGGVESSLPWELAAEGWRTDPAWWDGQAEKAVYEATRTIYGVERRFDAIAYTNKQKMDPRTRTKSSSDEGVEVFKHHWSERVPTAAYDYDFSTCTFTRTGDLAAYKLTAATQEDCGASFHQLTRTGEVFEFWESVYHPGAGVRQRQFSYADPVHFVDELSLVLRDYPFGELDAARLALVGTQKSARSTNFGTRETDVAYRGKETLELPIGTVAAHHLEVAAADGARHYWFAAEASAPWLHCLVRHEGPEGVTYRLKSLERTAYWNLR